MLTTMSIRSLRRWASGLALVSCWPSGGPVAAQEPIFEEKFKRIDQDKLLEGKYPLRDVVENGRHLFSTPFTEVDGYGEGGRKDPSTGARLPGPREASFQVNLKKLKAKLGSNISDDEFNKLLNFTLPRINPATGAATFPYYRLNGLDSQSCFECHNSIGSARLPGTVTFALTRKQSTVGGPAGSNSNAFINNDLPYHIFEFVRNPPHVFGTGYAQELAEEMSNDLLSQKVKAIKLAIKQPGTKILEPLEAKTTRYGTWAVTYNGKAGDPVDLAAVFADMTDKPEQTNFGPFVVDSSQVVGVSHDLIVRPLQWKGIASNERNFVKDACQFHFGMEAREKNPHFGLPNEDHDSDLDGHCDELSFGDVSALSIFTTTLRPPTVVLPPGPVLRASAERGRKIFAGELLVAREMSCSSCHTPALKVLSSVVVIKDPRVQGQVEFTGNGIGLSAQRKSSTQLPTYRRFLEIIKPDDIPADGPSDEPTLKALRKATFDFDNTANSRRSPDSYTFNLTDLQPVLDGKEGPEFSAALSSSLPRLPANADGSVDVPLFTDFKRHKMGSLLSEPKGPEFQQATDVAIPTATNPAGVAGVAEDEFLTRPLWGLADTGPWLHDGRAQSLMDAILYHDSPGSDATPVIAAFKALAPASQEDVIEFLRTLRLPIDLRYGFDAFP